MPKTKSALAVGFLQKINVLILFEIVSFCLGVPRSLFLSTMPSWWYSCWASQLSSAPNSHFFVCPIVGWGVGGGSGIPWNSPNPENCNEGVARLQSIGPFVSCCMDSAVLQGASMAHNALQIPLLFRFNKEKVGGYSMIWFAKLKSCLFFPGGGRKCPFWTLPLHFLWSHPVNHVTLSRGRSADRYLLQHALLFIYIMCSTITVLRLKTCYRAWLFPPFQFLCC